MTFDTKLFDSSKSKSNAAKSNKVSLRTEFAICSCPGIDTNAKKIYTQVKFHIERAYFHSSYATSSNPISRKSKD